IFDSAYGRHLLSVPTHLLRFLTDCLDLFLISLAASAGTLFTKLGKLAVLELKRGNLFDRLANEREFFLCLDACLVPLKATLVDTLCHRDFLSIATDLFGALANGGDFLLVN